MTYSVNLLIAGVSSFLLALVMTFVVREISKQKSILDHPNHRSSHSVPVPRLGGLAVAPAALIGSIIAAEYIDGWLIPLGFGALLLTYFGFVDDTKSMKPGPKYLLQLAAGSMATLALKPTFHINVPSIEVHFGPAISFVIAVVWITGVINVYNFVDGIDGLAAGVGVVTIVGLLVLGNGFASFFLIPLASALLGFLVWNLNPASIFMGDSGSQFVGFGLAVGAIGPRSESVNLLPVLIVFFPILFDTSFTILRRAREGKNILSSHREHLYQLLVQSGVSHRTVANLYYLLTAISVLASVGYVSTDSSQRILYPFAVLILLMLYAFGVTARGRRTGTSAS